MYNVDWKTIETSGFKVQATNPNEYLYSEIYYRATNKSRKNYPYLRFDARGLLTSALFETPPNNKVKVEYVTFNYFLIIIFIIKTDKIKYLSLFRYEVEAYYPNVLSKYSANNAVIKIFFEIDPVFDFQPFENKNLHLQNNKCK